ncbi:hypothetical protein TMatcc_003928 [Talaromyces marneffei ATCC 18224]|nr:uncharacterized protein EYB26_001086 [Talaromyces marneffei]KAE8556549.1 hypothetical protein EYB25_001250 [Talaromyces marneffei]QGA13436.1 hypothetical protein EYB26_001086 [Talaromyces marneffei]
MGSLGDLDLDASPVQRSKEENQERAFVAASRRKDRSLDARLESANRASMLHKKRTGKALHITKEIVEKEAMYEEVDERYQEKRLTLLKAHTTQLEAQFHRHLMATMAMSRQQQQQARVSPTGGIQKMRNPSVGSAVNYFENNHKVQIQPEAPISPTASSSTAPRTTSPGLDMYAAPSSSSSDSSSFAQTPSTGCYASTPLTCPQYIDTGLMSPSVSPRNSTYQQQCMNPMQSLHMRSTSMAQGATPGTVPYTRQRFASYPDVFALQAPQMVTPIQTIANINFRASSEPSSELSATPAPIGPVMTTMQEKNGLLPSPALSPPSLTTDSSQKNSCSDNTQFSSQVSPPVQVQFNDADLFKQQPLLGAPENPDPDYNEFLNFATNMEDQWQYPMVNAPFEDFMNLETLDCDMSHSGLYR